MPPAPAEDPSRRRRRALAVPLVLAAGLAMVAAGCGGGGTKTVTVAQEPPPAPGPADSGGTTPTPPTDSVATTLQPTPDTPPVDTTDTTGTTPVDTTETAGTTPVDTTDTTGTEPPPPVVERPADFPTAGEDFLLVRLREEVANRCTREGQDERSRTAIAGLVCDTRAALGAKSYYELFRSRATMEAAYARYRTAQDVPVRAGPCPETRTPPLPGENGWHFGAEGPTEGRVMCFRRDDGSYWYIWTEDRINAMGFATSPASYLDVARFWGNVGILSIEPR